MDLRPLGQSSVGTMQYDAASLVRVGPRVSLRMVVGSIAGPNKPLPDGRVAKSGVIDMEYDCQGQRARVRGGRSYTGLGLTGEVLERYPGTDWSPMDWTRAETPPGLYTVTCGAGR